MYYCILYKYKNRYICIKCIKIYYNLIKTMILFKSDISRNPKVEKPHQNNNYGEVNAQTKALNTHKPVCLSQRLPIQG